MRRGPLTLLRAGRAGRELRISPDLPHHHHRVAGTGVLHTLAVGRSRVWRGQPRRGILARTSLAAMLSVSLWSCGNIEYQQVGPNEYTITGRASLGALGGEPSAFRLARKSSELCPDGYDIIREKSWVFEGTVVERRMRCKQGQARP